MPSQTPNEFQPARRGWLAKFAAAFKGLGQGMSGQASFLIHVPAACAVLILAAMWQVSLEHWCLLLICIGTVLAAELFNSSLEWTCRSVTKQLDPNIERALNIASAAVLVVCVSSAIVGCLILGKAFLAI